MRRAVILLFFFLLLPLSTHAAVVNRSANDRVKNGLVGLWSFDGADVISGVARDRSGQNNNGNLRNIATSTFYTIGKIGQGFKFDGVDDYVQAGTATMSAGDFSGTECAWFNLKNISSSQVIVTQGDSSAKKGFGMFIGTRGTGIVSAEFYANYPVASVGTVQANKWNHVCIVKSPGAIESTTAIYINGVAQSLTTSLGNTPGGGSPDFLGTTPVTIGKEGVIGSSDFAGGIIDDVRAYSRALSAAEITALYNLGNQSAKTNTTKASNTTGLLNHWTFDGSDITGGMIRDRVSGNNGNLVSVASSSFYSLGKMGQGVTFDGVDDAIRTSSDSIGTGDVTVTAWIKPRSEGENNLGAIVNNGTFFFAARSTNAIEVRNNNNNLSSTDNNAITLGKWQFVTATRSGTNVGLYVNGVSLCVVSCASNDAPVAGNTNVYIGNRPAADRSFDGSIDDVRIYNRVLTQTEISKIYALGNVGVKQNVTRTDRLTDGLMGYWTFDGPHMLRNVADKSGQGNNGFMQNFTSTSTAQALGKTGQALKFDGVDDYVNVGAPSPLNLTGEMTIATWVYIRNTSTEQPIISYSNSVSNRHQWYLYTHNNKMGYIHGDSFSFTMAGDTTLSAGKWQHVAVVRTGTAGDWTVKMYTNGVLDKTSNTAVNPSGTLVEVRLGSTGAGLISGSTTYTSSTLDDTRIYNRALSTSEIASLYNIGR